jgi:hypothetical protein
LHKAAGSFQYGKGRMTLIEVADLRVNAECLQQTPPSYTKDQLLLQAQFWTSAIQLTGDASMDWKIRRVVAVQEEELRPADLDLPGP